MTTTPEYTKYPAPAPVAEELSTDLVGHFYNRPSEVGVEWCCDHLPNGAALYARPQPAVPDVDALSDFIRTMSATGLPGPRVMADHICKWIEDKHQ